MEIVHKNDFVELKFTGKTNGTVFDSNNPEDLKKLDARAEPEQLIVCVGEHMLPKGFDQALEGKEIGKSYTVDVAPKDAFGSRKQELIKTIPLRIFRQHNLNPYAGMTVSLDNSLAKVIAVSGARVITDFNHPLAGKDLHYMFTITRKVTEAKERVMTLCKFFLKFAPKITDSGEHVIIHVPSQIIPFIESFKEKFESISHAKIQIKAEDKEEKVPTPTSEHSIQHS